jgi:hypothetical protein
MKDYELKWTKFVCIVWLHLGHTLPLEVLPFFRHRIKFVFKPWIETLNFLCSSLISHSLVFCPVSDISTHILLLVSGTLAKYIFHGVSRDSWRSKQLARTLCNVRNILCNVRIKAFSQEINCNIELYYHSKTSSLF